MTIIDGFQALGDSKKEKHFFPFLLRPRQSPRRDKESFWLPLFSKRGGLFFGHAEHGSAQPTCLAERFRFDTPVKTQKALLWQSNKYLVGSEVAR
ncbi:hypothetical protein [uncultured Marinococcus sp.]|uniref:hypothetical protein n=1 Tax=uncultured Marinococcus sp. TaxID=487012 RepID=UPI002632C214|nr:hypothetical protein [uncultured Marinococcus sp.]